MTPLMNLACPLCAEEASSRSPETSQPAIPEQTPILSLAAGGGRGCQSPNRPRLLPGRFAARFKRQIGDIGEEGALTSPCLRLMGNWDPESESMALERPKMDTSRMWQSPESECCLEVGIYYQEILSLPPQGT
ncbi:hypothetical protein TREES_T100020364 [Tupaia chinensis]|uniref:Uncharacterized protein n=1 Tax=Tupaia chinensis TaxID=246437 RepID=L9L252_TUPCH|nr:hypothetical protein TREES_T100020364 [Tupaia chinensis]